MYARPQRVKDKRRRTFSGASENVSLMRVVTVACGSTSISTARVWPGCRHCVGCVRASTACNAHNELCLGCNFLLRPTNVLGASKAVAHSVDNFITNITTSRHPIPQRQRQPPASHHHHARHRRRRRHRSTDVVVQFETCTQQYPTKVSQSNRNERTDACGGGGVWCGGAVVGVLAATGAPV